jgi:nucleotide-binding universal stress UspA family protein
MNEEKSGSVAIDFPSFERILVAFDGMEISKRALSYAAYLSKISDSEIVIVHVLEANIELNKLLPVTTEVNLGGKEEQIDSAGNYRGLPQSDVLRKVIEETIAICKAVGVKKKITYEIRDGDSADEIIKVSKLMNVDLIVMGSRRIASKIQVIGSTARKVLTTVKMPVLIVQKQPRYKDEW